MHHKLLKNETLKHELNWEINDFQWESNENENEGRLNEQHLFATQTELTTPLILKSSM